MENNEKKVVELKDVELDSILYGYAGGKIDYTPSLFENDKIPEEARWSVELTPLSDDAMVRLESIKSVLKAKVAIASEEHEHKDRIEAIRKKITKNETTKQAGGEVSEKDELTVTDYMIYSAYNEDMARLDDMKSRYETILPFLGKLTNHKYGKKMTAKIWESTPAPVKNNIYNKICEISNLNYEDTINLLLRG